MTAEKADHRYTITILQDSIFCSSVDGHNIPPEDFNAYIKNQIETPNLVILLMTPAYMESLYCLMELGAAWVQSSKSLPIVVPPVAFDVVTKTLDLRQAWKIDATNGSSTSRPSFSHQYRARRRGPGTFGRINALCGERTSRRPFRSCSRLPRSTQPSTRKCFRR
ncbi:toll/interleukin-1 receptor domain-containing protein [Bradyrhizobium brasilense]|uniref:toll/interleukin-1 receptor domain-containing protein n=1 Tax=Bradyrhizobium brasilense TaxID=1419277 RepID=UPI0024B095FF|nr:toll/interleukin-1 receptor domain-containing protein [Bradyrhizobium australafricanum]WFU31285.1 toll/interleukin-1 receptor domain-containing protein [Bradyrhizobium australafricanum]